MAKKVRTSGVKRGRHLDTGKGYRLIAPRKDRFFKAALVTTFKSQGSWFAVFRVVK